MKRILFLETSETINGGQKMSLLISDELKARNKQEIVWMVPKEGELQRELLKKGYSVYSFGNISLPSGKKNIFTIFRYFFMSIKSISKILSVVKKEKIDVIYAPGPASLPWSAIVGFLKKKTVYWHLHHNFEDGLTKRLLVKTSNFKCVKKIISVSNSVASQLNGNDKIFVLYNPVNFEKYCNGDLFKLDKTIVQYKRDDIINILHIGLITPTKRQDISIDFASFLNEHGIKTELWIVGGKDNVSNDYLDEISVKVEKYPFVHYVGKQSNVEDWLQLADATIIPSIEGFPLAGLESLSAGVPLITINVSGAKELSEVSGCGLTFDNTDFKDILNKIQKFVKDKTVKINSQKFASSFDVSSYINKIDGVLNG